MDIKLLFSTLDLKLLLSTFGLVFLAELGDKTQLATLSLASSGHSRFTVFLGSAAALILTSAIAVVVGAAVARAYPRCGSIVRQASLSSSWVFCS